MSSTFGGIVQAGSGLAAASYGLQVISQNIDNSDTPGYTRETSEQTSADGVGGVPTIYTSLTGMNGVNVAATVRDNDPVLDARLRQEQSRSGVTDTTATTLSSVENVFPEPSDTGLTEQLNNFWNAWSNVANDPGETAPRQELLGAASTVTNMLNSMSGSLSDVAASTTTAMTNLVSSVNTQASQLYTLNKQIAVGNASGQDVNSLLDQRDTLLGQLSTEVGATVTYNADAAGNPNGTVDVSVGGQPLVGWSSTTANTGANQLQYDSSSDTLTMTGGIPSATPPIAAAPGLTLTGTPASAVVTLAAGQGFSYQQSLDPDASGTNTNTIAYYQQQLNSVASALATSVNAALTNSGGAAADMNGPTYDANGNSGVPMFGTSDGTSTVTAANITVTITDPSTIAASLTAPSGGSPSLDGTNALDVSQFGTTLPSGISPDKIYQSLVGTIGQSSALAQQAQTTQDSVTSAVSTLQNSASGVNTDEEISNLLTYQRAYQASAQVLNTMNSMLGTLLSAIGGAA